MISPFYMTTDAALGELVYGHMGGPRSRVMDEVLHAPKMFPVLNVSVTESIMTSLRIVNQGPEAPEPSADHSTSRETSSSMAKQGAGARKNSRNCTALSIIRPSNVHLKRSLDHRTYCSATCMASKGTPTRTVPVPNCTSCGSQRRGRGCPHHCRSPIIVLLYF